MVVVGGLVSLPFGAADAADGVARDTSLVAADATQRGQTSCEIERGEDDSDWVIRITRTRDGDGPETSRCVIVPPKRDEPPARTNPTPPPKRGGHDERNAR
jgi:ApbE superfamily uncharacterized protein (UPF0280 family)